MGNCFEPSQPIGFINLLAFPSCSLAFFMALPKNTYVIPYYPRNRKGRPFEDNSHLSFEAILLGVSGLDWGFDSLEI